MVTKALKVCFSEVYNLTLEKDPSYRKVDLDKEYTAWLLEDRALTPYLSVRSSVSNSLNFYTLIYLPLLGTAVIPGESVHSALKVGVFLIKKNFYQVRRN